MMNSYQQSQQQNPPLPPSLQTSSQVSGYQQYGSTELISYPTAHLYNNSYYDPTSYTDSEWQNCYNPQTGGVGATLQETTSISDPVTKAVVDNILGKLPTKKNQVMHRCDVCDQEFSGVTVLETHLAGAKHAKKVKSQEILQHLAASGQSFSQGGPAGNLRCEICGIVANSSQQLQTHLSGNKHKLKVVKMGNTAAAAMVNAVTISTSVPTEIADIGTNVSLTAKTCKTCNLRFNSTSQMQQHMESRRHKDKEVAMGTNGNKHHPYRRVGQARFQQTKTSKKKKQPLAFLTPLSSSFVPGSML